MDSVYHASVAAGDATFEALGHSRGSAEIVLKEALGNYARANDWAHGWYEIVSPKIKVAKIRIGRGYRDGVEIEGG